MSCAVVTYTVTFALGFSTPSASSTLMKHSPTLRTPRVMMVVGACVTWPTDWAHKYSVCASQSLDWHGRATALYGGWNLEQWQYRELGISAVELLKCQRRHNQQRCNRFWGCCKLDRGYRNPYSERTRHERFSHTDHNGTNIGIRSAKPTEPDDSSGSNSTVHGDWCLYRWEYTRPHEFCDLELVGIGCCDDQQ